MHKDGPGPGAPERGSARVLGVDPGTLRAGYAVVDVDPHGAIRYVDCGVLVAAGDDHVHRIELICADLRGVLSEFGPGVLALEQAYAGRNVSSAMKLAEARGAYRHVCISAGLVTSEYSPNYVKKALSGRARATKGEVVARMTSLYSLRTPPSEDAADALAIATCHAMHLRGAATPSASVGRLG